MCDTCLNSRPVVSENGIYYVCCLSSRAAVQCVTGKKDRYIEHPMRKEGEQPSLLHRGARKT